MKRALAVILSYLLVVAPAFADRTVYAPVQLAPVATAGTILFDNGTAAAPAIAFSAEPNTGIFRNGSNLIAMSIAGNIRFNLGPGIIYLGGNTVSSAPASGTLRATGGAGTNIAGGNLLLDGGSSTGTGAGGAVIFRTSPAGSSGSTANTLTERMRITSAGDVGIGRTPSSGYMLDIDHPTDTRIGLYNAGTRIGILQAASSLFSISGVSTNPIALLTNGVERARVKSNGQLRFIPLAADPAGAEAGDVYYNSGDNKLKVYNGTSWVDLH